MHLVLLLGVILPSTFATKCFTDAECGAGECCFRHEGPLIVSRRRQLDSLIAPHHGVCEKFQLEGERCSVFDKVNGHCSCDRGLHCAYVADSSTVPTILLPHKRSVIVPPYPGAYRCTPIV
ncbi:uncharacterized protein LOC125670380 [Ostrea edulis]|uniref:uncharacterized protein LOC125670380 n=1 Tax=Ostrea edulis TaxID=37623 RepID=UPI0020949542|nr:uncharacterized protein LOC125670380 [Ostrea edulis]